jgi:hypothetical protein
VRRRAFLLACVASARAQELPAVLELRLQHGELAAAQRRIVVSEGERVRWRVSSDAPGDLHLHAYRVAAHLEPGHAAEIGFVASATGRFPIEWHPQGGEAGGHREAPLAWLEVRPR